MIKNQNCDDLSKHASQEIQISPTINIQKTTNGVSVGHRTDSIGARQVNMHINRMNEALERVDKEAAAKYMERQQNSEESSALDNSM